MPIILLVSCNQLLLKNLNCLKTTINNNWSTTNAITVNNVQIVYGYNDNNDKVVTES